MTSEPRETRTTEKVLLPAIYLLAIGLFLQGIGTFGTMVLDVLAALGIAQ